MTLSQVLSGVTVTKIYQTMYGTMVVTHDVKVSGIQYDSRKVQRGNMFVAIRGAGTDGHRYLSSAIANGAAVVVVEDDASISDAQCMHTGVVKIVVGNTRKALAQISSNYFGQPSQKLTMIGVTGTNGKTTTTFLIKQLLEAVPGRKVGLIGTVHYAIGDTVLPATHTTPESLELHELFSRMTAMQCTHCVMEVSSHALTQYRVFGIDFAAAVFTNLTQDHLDYHGTMDQYLKAKKILFDGLNDRAVAVVNIDADHAKAIVADCRAKVFTYAVDRDADMTAKNVLLGIDGFTATVNGVSVSSGLVGRFNVYNMLAAYATVTGLGETIPDAPGAIARVAPAPGRFEQYRAPKGWTAIIDYAHTPDALENCLQAIHDILPKERTNRIITVFGAGGDRDTTKRPLMGAIAERLSDMVIVTSDNPRTEDPMAIIGDIMKGIQRSDTVIVQPDRAAAIGEAIAMARTGDVVLIAGKGHEDYQVVGTERHHFSDREEVVRRLAS